MASAHQRGKVIPSNIVTEKEGNVIKKVTLNTKALNVIWGGTNTNERYWKHLNMVNCEALELVGVYWLEVSGKLPISYLSPNTKYKLYFNIKLTQDATGWSNYPVFFNLRLPRKKTNRISMKLSELRNTNEWTKAPHGGLDIDFDQIGNASDSRASPSITFAMYEIECEDMKKGLIIRDITIEAQP